MTEAQKQRLEQQLWKIANELRGKMGADEFRDYILGFIFYKYLSEKQQIHASHLLETESVNDYHLVTDEEDIEAIKEDSLEKLGYFLRPEELFSSLTAKGNADTEKESNFILEDLQAILNAIEQSTMGTDSEDDFNKLFEDLDLGSTKLGRSPQARNNLIAKVLSHLEAIDFGLEESNADLIGDAYEYLIAQFASGAGKKAGEFYTPQQVSKILAKIVTLDKKRIKNAYDPACGSGSLLLRIAKEAKVGDFYGQELNRTTYNLARMNMILHGVHFSRFDIKQDDTLEHPQHLDMRFEAVVANPPFSAKWKGKDNPLNETDDRFSQYGKLAPTTKADFAFVQHMIYQLAESGTMAVVLPHGVLTRGPAEKVLRKYIINEQNYLDAVIGLPSNLFYGTGIPTCILIMKKCRVHDDDILFIDASQEFEKIGNKNAITDKHIDKIVDAYEKRENIDKYAYAASLQEIEKNDYNLNIPRYVDTMEHEEEIDIKDIALKLEATEKDIKKIDEVIAAFCKELNVSPPIGRNLPLLKRYKKGITQKLFAQEIRFLNKHGSNFPDWEKKRLGDILDYKQPTKYLVKSTDYADEFNIPVLTAGKTFLLGYTNETFGIFEDHLPTIIFDDFTTAFQYVDFPFKAKSSAMKMLIPKIESANIKYIYEAMTRINFPLGEHKRYWISEYQNETISYPVTEEQGKIANCLSAIDHKIKLVGTDPEQEIS